MNPNLKKIKFVHFVGIGGIGVSAIARMFLLEGKIVAGSDTASSRTTEELKKLDARIYIGHDASQVSSDAELLIYTIAVPENNPERQEALRRGIPQLSYPQLLGLLSKDKYTIAVSGTHGKTTTTGMIAKILLDAGFDPTVIIGSFLSGYESNFIAGKSKYLVVEACEYERSFLNINPQVIVITNIDNDHLDYYKDLDDIKSAFVEFVKKLPPDGVLITHASDPALSSVLAVSKHTLDAGNADIPTLLVPGNHNRENARLALSVAEHLGISTSQALASLSRFEGTWRRSQFKGKTATGALVYDDYAHHPTEIRATISAFRERFPKKEITVVFQPHLYSRTKDLLQEFAEELSRADYIILSPIYASREKNTHAISSKDLLKEIEKHNKKVSYYEDFDEIVKELAASAKEKDLIITMGAGSIYAVAEKLI
ncbi:MAG: UDP-N-acetylmuramate--L-alanine ligase [Patescibacteria group bacterium]